ncbi:hypothetical protein D3C81_1557310 [compost metagenome]
MEETAEGQGGRAERSAAPAGPAALAAARAGNQGAGLGRRHAYRHDRPGGRLPADPAGRPQPGWPVAGADQGRAQEALAGSGLPDAHRAHPRQPRPATQCLPPDPDGGDPGRGRDLPGPRAGDQPGAGVRYPQRHCRTRPGVWPGGGVDRHWPALPGAVAGLHRGRRQYRGGHPPQPDLAETLPRADRPRRGPAIAAGVGQGIA